MNRNLKKIWPALAVSLVIATSFVNAADNDMTRSKPNADMQKQKGSMGMITPPVNPAVQGVDFSFGVEALYMRATEDCESVGIGKPISGSYPQSFPVAEQQYEWSWGARAEVGYALPHDGWDIAGQWTWFQSSHSNDRQAPAGGGYYVPVADTASALTNGANVLFVTAQGLKSHRRLLLNMGDVDIGREFFISKWLTLRPSIGARGVWINRRISADTSNITAYPTGLDTRTTDIKTYTKGSYNAGGIFAGLDTQWGFGDGWSLYGVITQAVVYGRNHLSSKEIDSVGNLQYTRSESSGKWNTVRSITDLAIGLRWDYLFDNDRYRFRLQAGWEEHLFSNLDVSDFGTSGNLALTGASFKAAFDF